MIDLESGTISEISGLITINNNSYLSSKPAFNASRVAGHVASARTVIFDTVHFNRGNHYNPSTGYFTAPIPGVYWFYFWGMDANSGVLYQNDDMEIRVNDVVDLRIRTSTNTAVRTAISGGLYISLQAGDTVSIYNLTRPSLYGVSEVYSTFCGFLVG